MSSLLEELRAMRVSYSQFGEDLVVRTHFAENFDNSTGRFIDVGAFHPFKYIKHDIAQPTGLARH